MKEENFREAGLLVTNADEYKQSSAIPISGSLKSLNNILFVEIGVSRATANLRKVLDDEVAGDTLKTAEKKFQIASTRLVAPSSNSSSRDYLFF